MKTIQVLYGKTTGKFFGAFGLIVHSAICNASQQSMQYKGAVFSKLSIVNRFVNVQSEGKSISLVARLNDALLPKFLSHSFNRSIKTSHLKGFFTLNPTHAQSVIGISGLLNGKLAYFGISISKDNVSSPNLHFSLRMTKRKTMPSLMLKRMLTEEQGIFSDRVVSSSNRLEDINTTADSLVGPGLSNMGKQNDKFGELVDSSSSLKFESIQTAQKKQSSGEEQFIDISENESNVFSIEDVTYAPIKNPNDVEEHFRGVRKQANTNVKTGRETRETYERKSTEALTDCNNSIKSIETSIVSLYEQCRRWGVDDELFNAILDEIHKQDEDLKAASCFGKEEQEKLKFSIANNTAQMDQNIENLKNRFFEVSKKLFYLNIRCSRNCQRLLDQLNDDEISQYSQKIWDEMDAKNLIKNECKSLKIVDYAEKLNEQEYKFPIIWHEYLSVEENNHLTTRLKSYLKIFDSIEKLISQVSSSLSSQDIFNIDGVKDLFHLMLIMKRMNIFYSIAPTIINDAIKATRGKEQSVILEQNKNSQQQSIKQIEEQRVFNSKLTDLANTFSFCMFKIDNI